MDPCSAEAFEARYAADPDPWKFATSSLELARYDAVAALLARRHYRSGYEPACSVGALTVRLAGRCERLVAVDVAPTAVRRAADRCRLLPHVHLEVGSVTEPPDEVFDLVVLSELGYYFSRPALDAVLDGVLERLAVGGELVACHWTGCSDDHVLSGAAVHEVIARRTDLEPLRHHVAVPGETFLLDSWRRT